MGNTEIVTRQEWLAARKALLAEEKDLTRRKDELSAARRRLPMVKVEQQYVFQSKDGPVSLGGLFGPHRQLAVYHFMFGQDWEEGCPSCSFWADCFDGIQIHLGARNTAFACISNAPLATLAAYSKRLGWTFSWVSAEGTSFGADFGVTFDGDDDNSEYNYSGKPAKGEHAGFSAFLKTEDGSVCHSYSAFSRGMEPLNNVYGVLDMMPLGRDEDTLPWPMAWVRRNDKYEEGSAGNGV